MNEAREYPPGEYAIVELFGHTTLIGRIAEAERFGAKMLAIEPLFDDRLLDPIFHGGAAIYRLTPCPAEVAYARQPRRAYQLPRSIQAVLPAIALVAPAAPTVSYDPGVDLDLDDDPVSE